MPLPNPRPTETKKDFLRRCMMDETMISEFPDTDQRFAVCNTQYEDK
jgi:hypothetical protein